MKTNEEKVKTPYEAFRQGNVPFILENVDENFTRNASGTLQSTSLIFLTQSNKYNYEI